MDMVWLLEEKEKDWPDTAQIAYPQATLATV
jgi:hypothetical protein